MSCCGRLSLAQMTLLARRGQAARALLDETVKQFNAVEGILSYVSPVVGSHVGPGTLSIAYMAGM